MAATSSPGVETYINGLNPAGGGTTLLSATSGFSNCVLPLMAGAAPGGKTKVPLLTEEEMTPFVLEALTEWSKSGLTPEQQDILQK